VRKPLPLLASAAATYAALRILAWLPARRTRGPAYDDASRGRSGTTLKQKVKIGVVTLVGAGVLAAIGAAAFLWLGIYNVAATSGHAEITRLVLHRAMIQSVRAHAPDLKAPNLDDPEMIKLGAAHYLTGCAPCHGSPDFRASPIEIGATPPPPPLNSAAHEFKPAELHWIVKHGVKMTAMPPWPSQTRDDEVWAMVAFLEALQTMKPGEYAPLAGGGDQTAPTQTGATLQDLAAATEAQPCSACHGADGQGGGTTAPKLAGLSPDYIVAQLHDFRDGARASGVMQPVAVGLSDAAMARLANYFAQKPRTSHETPDPKLVAQGQRIAEQGLGLGPPACNGCHENQRGSVIPLLDGQSQRYLKTQLDLFRRDVRKGPNSPEMRTIAKSLTSDQVDAATAYFASRQAPDASAKVTLNQP
jgi:cytochrome c553